MADDVYAFVLDYSADKNRGEYDYALKLLFTDGTTKWVDVSEVNDDVVADGDVDESDLSALKDQFVSFSEKDGEYDVTTETATAVNGTITKGDSTIFANKTASSKTIFLVKKDGAYTVYTGIKNVPTGCGIRRRLCSAGWLRGQDRCGQQERFHQQRGSGVHL